MKWRRTQSEHVDDLRGRGGFGGIGGRGIAVGGGLGGILVLLASLLLGGGLGGGGGGGGLGDVLNQLPGAVPEASGPGGLDGAGAPPPTEESEFVTFLTEDVQAIWADEFQRAGQEYTYARTNMFTGQVQTACGAATSAVGPFYCPADGEVYIDLEEANRWSIKLELQADCLAGVWAHSTDHLLARSRLM